MDPDEESLPENYALALRLRRSGLDHAGIAERLGIEPEAVPSLLHLADAKLLRIKHDSQAAGCRPEAT